MEPLYVIDSAIEKAFNDAVDPETGEIIDESKLEEIDALNMERDAKIEGVGLYYKDIKAEAEMVKAEADNLAKRYKALENKAEGIKTYLSKAVNGEKFKTPKLSISFRKSTSTHVIDQELIPMEYLDFKDPVPKKTEIKKAIQSGKEVPGAELVENVSTIIK